jgi:DNA-binding NarL/FixJ family response regulator
MTGDLVSLRVLVVSSEMHDRDTLRQGAGAVPVPIDILEAGSLKAAAELLARGEIDIVFVDCRIADADRAVLLTAIRSMKPTPFVFLFVADRAEGGAFATETNADGIVVKPTKREEAKALLDRCGLLRLPRRVLLVDDSATMRSIVRKILTASRFRLEISEAEEGVDALKQVRDGKFDLVILDYNMPGLNGVETLSEIKRESPEVNVVMITSTPDAAITRKAQGAGAAAILKKPFYPSDLDAVLHSVFGLGSAAHRVTPSP